MSERTVVLMTASSRGEAEQIAETLVRELFSAAVNVVPGLTSIYRWQGQVRRAQERLLIAKSQRKVLDDLVRRVKSLHSYEVPQIVALPLVGGSEDYLRWLDGAVHGGWHDLD